MNTKLSAVGFAIQAAKGAAAAEPAWWHPVDGGKLIDFGVEQNEDELTSAEVGGSGEFRESVSIGASYGTRAFPASIAAYLYAALGAIQTTGAAAPFSHAITPAATVPWCTLFGKLDSELRKAADCKLDELKLEWEGNAPLKVTPTWAGMDGSWLGAAPTPDLDETLVAYLLGVHLAAVLDFTGAGYDGGVKVLGGSLDIKRNQTADVYSGDIMPGDVFEGSCDVNYEIKGRVPDLAPLRALLTGTPAGATISGEVPYGDVSLVFTDAPTVLTLASSRLAWKAEGPEADPKGGPGEVTFSAKAYGNPLITATAVNDVASYV